MSDSEKRPERDELGRLKPGHSVRSPGRPKLPDFVRERADDMWRLLLAIADGTKKDPRMSPAQAAVEVLDRVHGRPVQAHDLNGGELPPALVMLGLLAERRAADREAAQLQEGKKE